MRIAALDLGSNTSLLLIADVEETQLRRVVLDHSTVTKLGQGVHANRKFHEDALARMRSCLDNYNEKIEAANCDKVIAVATSAARDVSNGSELVKLGQERGIPIHIISGQREAALTFKGALFDREQTQSMAVIDVGGGSTEVITNVNNKVSGTSVDVGSVRLTEMFVKGDPISEASLLEVRSYAEEAFQRAGISRANLEGIVAVAGTPTTLAALDQSTGYIEERVHGYTLSLNVIEGWTARLSRMSIAERSQLVGMQPGRAEVIVAGVSILAAGIKAMGGDRVTVSTRGVRYGVALSWQDF